MEIDSEDHSSKGDSIWQIGVNFIKASFNSVKG